ncbi:uncharacterized protein LOC124361007 [Homalodisca vitripennis]|uniref:uncharacterized protein LOC124361007 n=1 Tax=Homalodisca vitripennis TaxID=197043 RepID=UPI001EECB943|nr:uncharacterized protein LOC124361007 [Homalodisca vitripennis]
MTDNEVSIKPDCWQNNEMLELISEESRPSLYSLSMSECSDTTLDLEGFDCSDSPSKHGPTPLENNFLNEKASQSMYEITEKNETSVNEESANNMNQSSNNKFRKCLSLHDVSNILPLPLTMKSANTMSCETIHSQSLSSTTKSKDSGFQRSVSFVSLASGRRNYDHVQSKVKAYIMNIKESEAIRKRNKLAQKTVEISEPGSLVDEIDMVLDKEDLILKIQELKHELQEKAIYIDAQQRNYNNLLLKLAEAKNTIDSLRLQRISLNYSSSLNNSQNLSSQFKSIDFDFLEKEINRRIKETELNKNLTKDINVCEQVTPVKEERCLSIETSTCSLTEVFTPKNHSTPKANEAKCLSPVSKMFSSSSRLDKNYKPLGNLRNQIINSNVSSQSFNHCSPQLDCSQYLPRKVKVKTPIGTSSKLKPSCIKAKTSGYQKTQTSHIDLPNDNPYDKVKKWQASLPNINLLQTQSSSEGECHDTELQGVEIGSLLSEELVSKCKISHSANHRPKNAVSKKQSKMHSFMNNLSNTSTVPEFGINENQKLNKEQIKSIRSQVEKIKCLEGRASDVKNIFKKQSLVFPAPIGFQDSSISESESHLPKSSSLTSMADRVLNNDSDEDSSSISSSVLGSTTPSPATSPIKRKSAFIEPKILNKVPKLITNKTNVVLRKPRLNVTLESIPQVKQKFSHKCSTNGENSRNMISCHIAESSERKAWNNRNNANFFVCKDFYFKKSSSLEDCLNLMEGMVQTGTSIIESALDRSHS